MITTARRAGSMTRYFANLVLDRFTRGEGAPPAHTYLGLLTSLPDNNDQAAEVDAPEYSRQPVSFTKADGGSTSNAALVEFPKVKSPWGTVVGQGVYDAFTGGHLLIGSVQMADGRPWPYIPLPDDRMALEAGAIAFSVGAKSRTMPYFENIIIDHMLRGEAYTPRRLYLGLLTSMPNTRGPAPEASSYGYSRRPASFRRAVGGHTTNSEVITWPTAVSPWGVLPGMGLFDARESGHLMCCSSFVDEEGNPDPIRINVGSYAELAADEFDMSLV